MKRFYLMHKLLFLLCLATAGHAAATEIPTAGQPAPLFSLIDQAGENFDLSFRQGMGWTVLYFYPKAGTPGCTTQACAYRDGLQAIKQQGAEVYGISADSVADLRDFQQKHHLNFKLLSDADAKVSAAYGVKIPLLNMAKRYTFILDPDLTIRAIFDDVDPALDARRVAEKLQSLRDE